MTTVSEDELYFVYQALDATVNALSIDEETSNLVMTMQEEALELVRDLLAVPPGGQS